VDGLLVVSLEGWLQTPSSLRVCNFLFNKAEKYHQ
jgi:hypothetical protein